jgi:hypothetical protein
LLLVSPQPHYTRNNQRNRIRRWNRRGGSHGGECACSVEGSYTSKQIETVDLVDKIAFYLSSGAGTEKGGGLGFSIIR